MKYLIAVFCLCGLFSCQEDVQKALNVITFDAEANTLHTLDLINAKLWLPKHFSKLSLQGVKTIVEHPMNESYVLQQTYEAVKHLPMNAKEPVFFQNDAMVNEIIAVFPFEYVQLDADLASYLVSSLVASLEQEEGTMGVEIEVIEKKLKSYNYSKMIKLKMKHSAMGVTMYTTQYYVTTRGKTFMTIVKSGFPLDYEEHIKQIKF